MENETESAESETEEIEQKMFVPVRIIVRFLLLETRFLQESTVKQAAIQCV